MPHKFRWKEHPLWKWPKTWPWVMALHVSKVADGTVGLVTLGVYSPSLSLHSARLLARARVKIYGLPTNGD